MYNKKYGFYVLTKGIVPCLALVAFTVLFVVIFCLYSRSGVVVETISAIEEPVYPVFIIDPGHGGNDGGAVSSTGILEKDINLKISEYIFQFCKLSGINCVMTRTDDEMLTPKFSGSKSTKRGDLIARTEFSSLYDNAVFVSIHQNKFESSKYKGLQVFYSKNNECSSQLASLIKETNNELLDSDNLREIKPAGSEIYVLDNVSIPAVLVECGFLSNFDEAEKLNTDEYQKQLAFMIFASLMKYVDYDINSHESSK